VPTIDAALTARILSSLKDQRVAASKKLVGPKTTSVPQSEAKHLMKALQDALYASKVCSYAQGMALIKAGSDEYKWGVDLGECARIWKGGCIIRAKLLEQIRAAFARDAKLPNLLMDKEFSSFLNDAQDNWRQAVGTAIKLGIPVPALSASLAYFDSYRCASLPQNLTQAQRDFFGAHTFERTDKPEAGFMHLDWPSLVRTKAAKK
jgi:6-phosphogluconate dehydrogenase